MNAFLICFKNLRNETVYLLLKELPSAWHDGIPTYNMGDLIESVIAEDPEDRESFEWSIAGHPDQAHLGYFYYSHIEPGECNLIELNEDEKIIRLKRCLGKEVTNAKLKEHMTCQSECVDEVDVSSDARFIVRYHDQLDDSDHLILLKKLPMSWCDGVPIYQLKDYVWDLNEDNKYTVEGPYGTVGSAYDWGVSTLGVGYVAGFKVKGDTLEFEEIYSRPFVTEDTVTHIGGKIAYISKGTHGSIVDEVNESVDPPISDNVNHPSHYTSHPSGVECIEITKHHDFCIGNAIKYLWRQGLKQDADKSVKEKRIEDLKKAIWYINAEIALIEKDRQGSEL